MRPSARGCSRCGWRVEASRLRGGSEGCASAGCRRGVPGRGGFSGGSVTRKRPHEAVPSGTDRSKGREVAVSGARLFRRRPPVPARLRELGSSVGGVGPAASLDTEAAGPAKFSRNRRTGASRLQSGGRRLPAAMTGRTFRVSTAMSMRMDQGETFVNGRCGIYAHFWGRSVPAGERSCRSGERSARSGERSHRTGEAFPRMGECFPFCGKLFPRAGTPFPLLGERSGDRGGPSVAASGPFPREGRLVPFWGGPSARFGASSTGPGEPSVCRTLR